jgi:peptide deformylase
MVLRLRTIITTIGLGICAVVFLFNQDTSSCEGLSIKKTSSKTSCVSSFNSDRRNWLFRSVFATGGVINGLVSEKSCNASTVAPIEKRSCSRDPWTGTNLSFLSLEKAVATTNSQAQTYWLMGRWPDPILRRAADPVDERWFHTPTLQQAAKMLKNTADQNGAVGLAAQQCGVNVRMIYLSPQTILATSASKREKTGPTIRKYGTILVNPYIIGRSPEEDMRVWKEECLVLPPSFRATVLRDDWIDVQYQTVDGQRQTERFYGETSRCLQHEMDHDRGILITDHVGLDELPRIVQNSKDSLNMQELESPGHAQRMQMAYARYIDTPSSGLHAGEIDQMTTKGVVLASGAAAGAQYVLFPSRVHLGPILRSQKDDNDCTPLTMEELQSQLSYIEALEERNKAQLDSFIDEQDQWNSMEPNEQDVLMKKQSILEQIKRFRAEE